MLLHFPTNIGSFLAFTKQNEKQRISSVTDALSVFYPSYVATENGGECSLSHKPHKPAE